MLVVNSAMNKASGVVYQRISNSITASIATLPQHYPGWLLVLWAQGFTNTIPTVPTAGGTVPTWNVIHSLGGNNNSGIACWARVDRSDATSGTWTNAGRLTCVSFSQQSFVNPIGGQAIITGSSATEPFTVTAPAITLADSSGKSAIFHYIASNGSTNQFGAAPTGYTNLLANAGQSLMFKNVTTTDGGVARTINRSTSKTFVASSVEIRTLD